MEDPTRLYTKVFFTLTGTWTDIRSFRRIVGVGVEDAARQLLKENSRWFDQFTNDPTNDAVFLDKAKFIEMTGGRDRRLGSDGRISSWSYNWTAKLVHRLGFRTLGQVDEAIKRYDDDRLSRVASGARQGQTTRFETMLLAALGEEFIRRHVWAAYEWFGPQQREFLNRFKSEGIPVGVYDPMVPVLPQVPPNNALEPPAEDPGG